MFKTKEQDKTPELIEVEISNFQVTDKDFKVILMWLSNSEEWINGVRHFNKEWRWKETNRVEEYSNWNKNTPEGIKNTLDDTEEMID